MNDATTTADLPVQVIVYDLLFVSLSHRVRRSWMTLSHCWGLYSSFHSKMKFSISFDRLQRTLCSIFVQSHVFQHRVRTALMNLWWW